MVIIVGVVFSVIGIIVSINWLIKKYDCTEVTTGKVVDISKEVTTRNTDNYHGGIYNNVSQEISLYPIVEYTVRDNKYVKKLNTNSNMAFVGQEIEVHYNPQNPNKCYFGKNLTQIIFGVLFTIAGVAMIIVPLLIDPIIVKNL